MSAPADLTNVELNTAIGLEVCGYGKHMEPADDNRWRVLKDGTLTAPWSPATDIAAAFEVVERMRKDTKLFGRFVRSLWYSWPDQSPAHENDALAGVWWLMMHITPRAICEAALAAVRSES